MSEVNAVIMELESVPGFRAVPSLNMSTIFWNMSSWVLEVMFTPVTSLPPRPLSGVAMSSPLLAESISRIHESTMFMEKPYAPVFSWMVLAHSTTSSNVVGGLDTSSPASSASLLLM